MDAKVRTRRMRNPEATRELILDAARSILAAEGIEGLSVSAVAHAAGVNRGTAYMHFESRERLIAETISSVSEIILHSVYGDQADLTESNVEAIDQEALTENLACFAMANPDLCRVWLLQVMASDNPSEDPFWRKYMLGLRTFSLTERAEPGLDAEVLAVIVLAGAFLWPVWCHAQTLDEDGKRRAASRFSQELIRLSLHGSMVVGK